MKEQKNKNIVQPVPGRISNQNCKKNIENYQNPYEYGSRQNVLPSQPRPLYQSNQLDATMMENMALTPAEYSQKFPNEIRNVNVESVLQQKEPTRFPGQRQLTQTEMDRFQLLPFNPQYPDHLVWKDCLVVDLRHDHIEWKTRLKMKNKFL